MIVLIIPILGIYQWEEPSAARITIGVLADSRVISFMNKELRRSDIFVSDFGGTKVKEYCTLSGGEPALRIRLAYKSYWFSSPGGSTVRRVPEKELIYYDYSSDEAIERIAVFKKLYPLCRDLGRSCHHWGMEPLVSAWRVRLQEYGPKGILPPSDKPPFADFLPTSAVSGSAFVLHPDGLISVWHGEATWKEETNLWSLDWTKKPVWYIQSKLDEQFFVLPKKDALFFLTDSGKLFRVVEESKDGKQRKVLVAVWSDPKKPIHAVLTDADADKHYLFGKESKEKGFFFELDARPRPRPFAFADLPDNRAEEHLRTILRYATLLRPQKKK